MNYKLACDSYFLPQAMDGGWAAAHKLFIAPVQQRWSSGCHHSLWDWKPEIEIMVERTNRTMPGLSDNRPAIRKVTKITIWLRSILSCATTTTTTMLMKRIHTLFIRFFDRSHTFSWNVKILSLSSISGHGIMKQGVFKVYPMRWAPPGYISKSFFFLQLFILAIGWVRVLKPFFSWFSNVKIWNGQWQGCANVKMLIVAPFAASTTTTRYDQAYLRFIQKEKQNYRRICLIYYSSNMDINFMTCVQIEVSSNSKDANQSSIMVSVPLPAKLIPTLLARTSSYIITTKSDPKFIFSRHDNNC